MSKELLPELPEPSGFMCHADERAWDEWQVREHGQACYEAGRKSVDLEQFRPMVAFLQMAGVDAIERGHSIAASEAGLKAINEADRLLAIIDGEKS